MTNFRFGTDTATLCIFDTEVLSHRINDRVDWWSIPSEELSEVNAARAFICGLGSDGVFEVVLDQPDHSMVCGVSALLIVQSGEVYIGPGEDLCGGGSRPHPGSRHHAGSFLSILPGTYRVKVAMLDDQVIHIALSLTKDDARNCFSAPIML